ncbi:hypothetical protein D3C77_570790 [compost metagenome]
MTLADHFAESVVRQFTFSRRGKTLGTRGRRHLELRLVFHGNGGGVSAAQRQGQGCEDE